MTMTREEKLAYQRGYNARVTGRWPDHKPPTPPDPIVRKLVEALLKLRGDTNSIFASMFEDDDEIWEQLDPAMDQADEALKAFKSWIRE